MYPQIMSLTIFLAGDAYLKYLSTTYVFVISPAQHEGALHQARLRIISNRALLLNGDAAGLPPFIQSKPFISKLWAPLNFALEPPPPPSKEKLEARARARREADEAAAVVNAGKEKTSADETAGVGVPGAVVADKQPGSVRAGITQAEVKREPSPDPPLVASANVTASIVINAADAANPSDVGSAKKPGKRGRKRKAAEQRDVHWLGDKVSSLDLI